MRKMATIISWVSCVVTVIPKQYVSTPGGYALFTCLITSGVDVVEIRWLVNGTESESLNLANVSSTVQMSTHGRKRGRLEFTHLPVEYNTTTVRCVVIATDQNLTAAQNSTLLIQGWAG